jgi:hypothetical protein
MQNKIFEKREGATHVYQIKKQEETYGILTYVVVSLGVALSLWQFFQSRSLWHDEANLAINIVERSYENLLLPLDRHQMAPIGFLLIEKLFFQCFGQHDLSLRILPLLSFWASIYFVYQLSSHLFKTKIVILLACTFFIFNPTILYFSSELKQYSGDVLFAISFAYLSIKHFEKSNYKYILLSIIGSIGIFFSNISPIILFCSGIYLFSHKLNSKIDIKKFPLCVLSWIISFGFYYLYFIKDHPCIPFMNAFWQKSFFTLKNGSHEFYYMTWKKIIIFCSTLFKFPILLSITLITAWLLEILQTLRNKGYAMLSWIVLPLIVHVCLSSLELYPFDTRFLLYITPIISIVAAKSIYKMTLKARNITFVNTFTVITLLFLCISVFFIFPKEQSFPYKREEFLDVFQYVENKKTPIDHHYIFYGSEPAYTFYHKTGQLKPFKNLNIGHSYRGKKEKYISEIIKLKGTTCLLFSHSKYDQEEKYILQHLDSMGFHKIDHYLSIGASAYIYQIK